MISPNSDYRPNPARAVYIQGIIDQKLVDRLTPQIILLQQHSRDPITVYIDSPGGSIASAQLLVRLLKASDQDGSSACRLITVVTGEAASAAADLLSTGDYAIAFNQSTVHYHGVRTSLLAPLTVEAASYFRESLRTTNDQYALSLARRSNSRFLFRYALMKPQFSEFRVEHPAKAYSDLQCFIGLLSSKLSVRANEVVEKAEITNRRYEGLLAHLRKRVRSRPQIIKSKKRIAEVEAAMLKAVIDFELSTNRRSEWTFRDDDGLEKLTDDFLLLREFLAPQHDTHLRESCELWHRPFLSDSDRQEIEACPDEERAEKRVEKLMPHLEPLWFFFVAVCWALQGGENRLTAEDAFWLGLIDEVIGLNELPCLRYLLEFSPDPPVPSGV